jgi:hypothetical protein
MKRHFWRCWEGPIVGRTVSHIWSSFAWCLFLEFGELTERIKPDGTPGNAKGEWTLTTMDSWPHWTLFHEGRVRVTSEYPLVTRELGLKSLIGRNLESIELNEASRKTRLTFSFGFVLNTMRGLHHVPHWMFDSPESGPDDWPRVAFKASTSLPASQTNQEERP